MRLLLVGDAHEQCLVDQIARQLDRAAINTVGQTSLRELLALVAHAQLVVTNDTGTMHIAAALQRPLVALVGPTHLTRFAPLGDRARQRVLQAPSHRVDDVTMADAQRAVEELMP